MDLWADLILKWANCLYDNESNGVKNLEDLQDGKIYCELISKVGFRNYETEICEAKDLVLQFLKDEYPKFVLSDKDNECAVLYVAPLIFSRLSLEPIFQKSLCTHLQPDLQLKVKFILETIYFLGKNLVKEDIREIFFDLSNTNTKNASTQPQNVLKNFLNSPLTKSVNNQDSILYEQSKELKRLKASIETLRYEKSELVQDIKIQEKHIEDLQKKLQSSLSELKSLRDNTLNTSDYSSYDEVKEKLLIESSYEKELKSLEDYAKDLQNSNLLLQEEKITLTNKISWYEETLQEIQEKHVKTANMLDSALLQMDNKDEELKNLKYKYEELNYYLKEKSKICAINQSFDLDDKINSEISLNTSEALSSVVEIQLQDARKEITLMETKYKEIDVFLTIILEEFVKLQTKIKKLNEINTSAINENCIGAQKSIENQLKSADTFMVPFEDIFKDNLKTNLGSLFLNLINKSDNYLNDKKLSKRISFQSQKENTVHLMTFNDLPLKNSKSLNVSSNLGTSKNVQLYLNHKDFINYIPLRENNEECSKIVLHENWIPELFSPFLNFVKIIKKESETTNFSNLLFEIFNRKDGNIKTYSDREIVPIKSKNLLPAIQYGDTKFNNYLYLFLKNIEKMISYKATNVKYDLERDKRIIQKNADIPSLNESELKLIQSFWNSLQEFIRNDLNIYKVILLLERNWNLHTMQFNNVRSIVNLNEQDKRSRFKRLLKKQILIKKLITNMYSKNFEILSFNFITAVQFVTVLNEFCNFNDLSYLEDEPIHSSKPIFSNLFSKFNSKDNSNFNLQYQNDVSVQIIDLYKKINQFHRLVQKYEEKNTSNVLQTNPPQQNKEKMAVVLTESSKKVNEESRNNIIDFQEDKENYFNKLTNDIKASQMAQFNQYLKEVHEKYELKLNKMKEKMKSAYNSEIATMKKEQELMAMKKLEALQQKIEYQCYKHTEELKKYKKHISELTTQLWNVGEKLIIERQKKEELTRKLDEFKGHVENTEIQNVKSVPIKVESNDISIIKPDLSVTSQSIDNTGISNFHCLESFKMMGNAFGTEDEEGEVFDTTYLSDLQKAQKIPTTTNIDRLSILQLRNSKCRPHLKSSYPTELESFSLPVTEDDIKSGNPTEELFNDSLSQSLLTGKKVKRKDRARNASETPRRSSRRFSNIFRKARLTSERK